MKKNIIIRHTSDPVGFFGLREDDVIYRPLDHPGNGL